MVEVAETVLGKVLLVGLGCESGACLIQGLLSYLVMRKNSWKRRYVILRAASCFNSNIKSLVWAWLRFGNLRTHCRADWGSSRL